MPGTTEQSVQVTISNRMGFHVRPVKRFSEFAAAFRAEVEVEARGKTVPGDSIMKLMVLAAQCGDTLNIRARGEDARQCVQVLRLLAEDSFFVEDDLAPGERPDRHVERLAMLASCFDSQVTALLDGRSADAKDCEALSGLGLTPASRPEFRTKGHDADQALAVVRNLVSNSFYVEEEMVRQGGKKGR